MNKGMYKRIIPQRLQFPTDLEFRSGEDGLLVCNDKSVQVIPSLPIKPSDNPPTDLNIYGIGKYNFEQQDADIIIFSFVNSQTQMTDCAIIKRDELLVRLEPYHHEGDKINLKLILTVKGLHECFNVGAEAFFIAIWNDKSRDYSGYHNNWSVFDDLHDF